MAKRTCIEDGCERAHYGRGWCSLHYQRAHHAGKLESRPRELVAQGASLDERLRHIGWTVTASGCWEFNGGKNARGYGQMAVGDYVSGVSTPRLAPRVAYEAWVGPIPDGVFICHKCDNPPCVNPAHLFLGTSLVNVRDMVAKGRNPHGERHAGHTLSDANIAELRARYAAGGVSQRVLGHEYGVSQQLVSRWVRGELRPKPTRWLTP